MTLVPISYTVRSLFVRKSSTFLTVASIGATVAVLAGLLSLQQGFATMFTEHGREDLAVFLRPGATSEGESSFPRDRADILIKGTSEIAEGPDGQPLASGELYLASRLFKIDGGETNVPLRGVQPASFLIQGGDLRIVEGRNFIPGSDEVIVGEPLVERIRNCRVGDVLTLNTTPFKVVGVFAGKGGYASEIWGDTDRMMTALERRSFSRIVAKLEPDADVEALAARLEDDKQVPAQVMTERVYLENQTAVLSGLFIGVGVALGLIMGLGAVFTGTNAMFSALSARTHEIGILVSLGFRPWAILIAFLLESTLLGLVGGVFGCLLALPLQGIRTGTMNMQTFSEVAFAFQITPTVLVAAVVFSLLLGLFGGLLPAIRAARMSPTEALRRA